MNKKLTTLLLIFTLLLALLIAPAAYADPSTDNEQNSALTEYVFGNDNMNISLPADWYINTPDEIDSDFLQVTENTERRLKKYLEYSDIEFNLLSKDLKQEINVILVHNSRTKMMFDFNIIDESSLSEQGQVFVDQGAQESDSGSMTYESFVIKKINDCKFIIFDGFFEDADGKGTFRQYTTTINGYGITFSSRVYNSDDTAGSSVGSSSTDDSAASGALTKTKIVDDIVDSLQIDVVEEVNLHSNIINQLIPPILLVVFFVSFTIYLIIRQIRKNNNILDKAKHYHL